MEGSVGEGHTDLRRVGGPAVDPPEQLAAWNNLHGLQSLRHGIPCVPVSMLSAIVLEHGAQGQVPEGQRPWECLPDVMLSPEQRCPPGKGMPVWTWLPYSLGAPASVCSPPWGSPVLGIPRTGRRVDGRRGPPGTAPQERTRFRV